MSRWKSKQSFLSQLYRQWRYFSHIVNIRVILLCAKFDRYYANSTVLMSLNHCTVINNSELRRVKVKNIWVQIIAISSKYYDISHFIKSKVCLLKIISLPLKFWTKIPIRIAARWQNDWWLNKYTDLYKEMFVLVSCSIPQSLYTW